MHTGHRHCQRGIIAKAHPEAHITVLHLGAELYLLVAIAEHTRRRMEWMLHYLWMHVKADRMPRELLALMHCGATVPISWARILHTRLWGFIRRAKE